MKAQAMEASEDETAITGTLWWDVSTGEISWSEESYRLLGYLETIEPTFERIFERVHPEDLALVRKRISRSAAEGVNTDLEHRLLMPGGAVKHVHVVIQKVGVSSGAPLFVGALTDITQRKRTEADLRRAYDQLSKVGAELEHVSRVTALGALAASIAHEVNQPLSGIIINASTCLKLLSAAQPDIERARLIAQRTIRDANRATDVIGRLRALFSKRESKQEPVDLNEAAREVIALSASDLQKHRIVVQAELGAELPRVRGDRIQIQQVLLNLLRNASDAMTEVHDRPRQLLIKTAREHGDRVRLTVRDAGVGFSRQSADSLFDPFYTTKSGGMGIGLFVSRSIVERHRGRLWAEPNEGPGATFSFSIPRCTEG